MAQISKYFASLGFEIDKKSLKDVDRALDSVEKRLKRFGTIGGKALSLDFGNFNVDQRKLNMALGNALDLASARVVFDLNRFSINQAALNRDVAMAMTRASSAANLRVNPRVSAASRAEPSGRVGRTSGAVGGGLIGRGIGGLYGPALALGLGGYGLSNLNERNQQVVSAQLQSQAVVQQAGGTVEQGQQSFEWLRNQANRIGFNYLDASPDYNKLLSGLTGAGMSVSQGQGVFKGFSELSRVNKLDRTQQQRVFRALSQIAGKNKLQSEELTGQLAESLPSAVSLFANAYQDQLASQGKGGGKTGQEAITELFAAMKKGQVKGDILTFAGTRASSSAAAGLTAAGMASQAEQARYQNSVNDLAVVASNAGVEEGFARIFRTLNAGLSESGDLVKGLAEGFNEATKWADDLLLFPQSFIRALEGKDSLVGDWLGADQTAQLRADWENVKQIFTDISSIKFDFLPTLEATAKEIAAIMNAISQFQQWKNNLVTSPSQEQDASFLNQPITWAYQQTGKFFNGIGEGLDASRDRGAAVFDDPNSYWKGKPEAYDDNKSNMADMFASLKESQRDNAMTTQVSLTINVDPQTLANMDIAAQAQELGNSIAVMFEQANVNFPIRE